MIYQAKRTAIVIVPESLREAIEAALDRAIDRTPGAEVDRDYLYSQLLGFFDEYGYIPEFSLVKAT